MMKKVWGAEEGQEHGCPHPLPQALQKPCKASTAENDEKNSKIMKSYHPTIPTMSTNHVPKHHIINE